MRKISIFTLMAMVVISAISLAALRNADQAWARLMTTLALATILFAVVSARLTHRRERAWWWGFAAVAGSYLVLSLSPWRQGLFTTHLLEFVHDRVEARTVAKVVRGSDQDTEHFKVWYEDGTVRDFKLPTSVVDSISSELLFASFEPSVNRWRSVLPGAADGLSFGRVGHSLFSVFAGLIGGTAIAWFYASCKRGVAVGRKQRAPLADPP
jgi:hypothetical protein